MSKTAPLVKEKMKGQKGFNIEVKNNLLEPKHKEKMGIAVWEFMWLLDKITSIQEGGLGIVLGGSPLNLKDIQEEIGGGLSTISENLNRLERENYINLKRVPYGLIITVNKAWKTFKRIRKSEREFGNPNKNSEKRTLIKTYNKDIYKDIGKWPQEKLRAEVQ